MATVTTVKGSGSRRGSTSPPIQRRSALADYPTLLGRPAMSGRPDDQTTVFVMQMPASAARRRRSAARWSAEQSRTPRRYGWVQKRDRPWLPAPVQRLLVATRDHQDEARERCCVAHSVTGKVSSSPHRSGVV